MYEALCCVMQRHRQRRSIASVKSLTSNGSVRHTAKDVPTTPPTRRNSIRRSLSTPGFESPLNKSMPSSLATSTADCVQVYSDLEPLIGGGGGQSAPSSAVKPHRRKGGRKYSQPSSPIDDSQRSRIVSTATNNLIAQLSETFAGCSPIPQPSSKPSTWLSLSEKAISALSLSATWAGASFAAAAAASSRGLPSSSNSSANSSFNAGHSSTSSNQLELLKISADDFASQITLLDFPSFKGITAEELLSVSWTTSKKLSLTPNIVAYTRRFNQVSFWVVEEVLRCNERVSPGVHETTVINNNTSINLSHNQFMNHHQHKKQLEIDAKVRAEVIVHFIKIAKRLLEDYNNLHSCYAIVSALNSSPLYRLRKSWSYVGKKDRATFDRLCSLFSDDSNFEKLRDHCSRKVLPCLPYLGMYLRDLIYVDVANPTPSPSRDLKMSNIVNVIQNFQLSSYGECIV